MVMQPMLGLQVQMVKRQALLAAHGKVGRARLNMTQQALGSRAVVGATDQAGWQQLCILLMAERRPDPW
jgi:hypothetical protein